MKRNLLVFLLCVLCGSAFVLSSDTTQPTTAPTQLDQAKDEVDLLNKQADEARKSTQDAIDAATGRAHHSDEYRRKQMDVDRLAEARNEARKGSDPQAKIEASSAYGKGLNELKKMEADAIANDPSVSAAKVNEARALADLVTAQTSLKILQGQAAELEKARLAQLPTTKPDPIRDGKLIVGMTEEEARQAMHAPGRKAEEWATGCVIEWNTYSRAADGGEFSQNISANFEDGKITEISRAEAIYHEQKRPSFSARP
jgi:hypothetical protein